MHGASFLQDLAVVMVVAAIATVLCHRLRQPVVLGYIIAGFIVGPHALPEPLIHDQATIRTLADLGMVFLMFSLGLEFSLKKLKEVGGTAFIAAPLEILLMIFIGYFAGRSFGWSEMDCLFLGATLSISSSTVVVKVLRELGLTKEKYTELIFGILIVEDILAVVMLALLSGIGATGKLAIGDVAMTVLRLGVFLVTTLVVGLLVVPQLLRFVARTRSNEMLLVTLLGICLGAALLAVKLDFSAALGAFVIGAVVAEARDHGRIHHLAEPIRDMFSAIFFVAIGLLIDPKLLAEYWFPTLVLATAVIVGKTIACSFGIFVAGYEPRTALRVGTGLGQIGEFSFIIAGLGLSLGVTSEFLYPIAVCVSVITTVISPQLIQRSDALVSWFDRIAPARVLAFLEVYSGWIERLRQGKSADASAWREIRRVVTRILLKGALIAAAFVIATFVARLAPEWIDLVRDYPTLSGALIWLATVLGTLPLYIRIIRSLRQLGQLLSEATISATATPASVSAGIRPVVTAVVLAAGSFALTLMILFLSAALLPPWNVVLVLLAIVAGVTVLFRRTLDRVYVRAEQALEEVLVAQTPNPARLTQTGPLETLSTILKNAQLETITLSARAAGAGKRIRALDLRAKSGASIVGIERAGKSIINPGPDLELLAGDRVLLMGDRSQLDAGRVVLIGVDARPSELPPPYPAAR